MGCPYLRFIERILGEESHQYLALTEFSFMVYPGDHYISDSTQKAEEYKEQHVTQLIDNAISTINEFGLYELPKGNLISRMPNGWLITTVIGIIVSSVSAGWYIGYNRFDTKKLDLYEKNQILEKKLIFISDSLIRNADTKEKNRKRRD